MSRTDNVYKPALEGKNIPILTLDSKWHQLFSKMEKTEQIISIENELNELLRRQGRARLSFIQRRRMILRKCLSLTTFTRLYLRLKCQELL